MTRARLGVTLAVVGGGGLLAALWLPWYSVGGLFGANTAGGVTNDLDALSPEQVSGWAAFATVDVWLAVAGAAAVAVAVARRSGPVPLLLRGAAVIATVVALVMTVVRVVKPPDLGITEVAHGIVFGGPAGFDLVGRAWGVWVALGAALLAAAGAALLLDGDRAR